MHLSGLFIYPVKSLRGIAVSEAAVDQLGMVGDRRFLVVDETGRFLTQRSHTRMALIDTALTSSELILSAASAGQIKVLRASDPAASLREVSVWKSTGLLAEDCGEIPAQFLSDFLQTRCRLVRIGEKFHRPVTKAAAAPGDIVSFADAVSFLVISEASLHELNDRLVARDEEALPMSRFRPNLVIAGAAPFAEDAWPRVRVGEIVFRAAGPCARCIVTTTDQLTGERGKEPLRTLATYRRDANDPTNVNFGQNLIHETLTGTLRIGNLVTPL